MVPLLSSLCADAATRSARAAGALRDQPGARSLWTHADAVPGSLAHTRVCAPPLPGLEIGSEWSVHAASPADFSRGREWAPLEVWDAWAMARVAARVASHAQAACPGDVDADAALVALLCTLDAAVAEVTPTAVTLPCAAYVAGQGSMGAWRDGLRARWAALATAAATREAHVANLLRNRGLSAPDAAESDLVRGTLMLTRGESSSVDRVLRAADEDLRVDVEHADGGAGGPEIRTPPLLAHDPALHERLCLLHGGAAPGLLAPDAAAHAALAGHARRLVSLTADALTAPEEALEEDGEEDGEDRKAALPPPGPAAVLETVLETSLVRPEDPAALLQALCAAEGSLAPAQLARAEDARRRRTRLAELWRQEVRCYTLTTHIFTMHS
jgi:hypothetical protein